MTKQRIREFRIVIECMRTSETYGVFIVVMRLLHKTEAGDMPVLIARG
jgi:hypothetical protein